VRCLQRHLEDPVRAYRSTASRSESPSSRCNVITEGGTEIDKVALRACVDSYSVDLGDGFGTTSRERVGLRPELQPLP